MTNGSGVASISDDLPGPRGFVFPEHRVLWVSVAKNACTSLKWMLAEMSGQDRDAFYRRNGMRPDITQTIHLRGLWRGVPTYTSLSPENRAAIHPDNGWFIFGVTRDPRVRLFSAFYSKLLSHHPRYLTYANEPFYPDLPRSAEDVVASFAAFVRFLHDNPEHRIASKDVHFRPQSELLATSAITYSRIYDIDELGTMVDDLHRHLKSAGYTHRPALPRENRAPLLAYRALFGGEVRRLIDRRYAGDLAEFGERWDFDSIPDVEPNWPPALFDSIAATAAAYDQVARLSRPRRPAVEVRPRPMTSTHRTLHDKPVRYAKRET